MDKIADLQSKFRLLNDWEICMEGYPEHSGHCIVNLERKKAIIEIWHGDIEEPDDYILHELLHIAIRAVQNRNNEEVLVQDICKIIQAEEVLI